MLPVSHSTAASPCPGAGVRGPGALYFDFQDNSALLGSQHCCALACRTPTGRWALVRRVVQAPRHLLPNLVCLSSASSGPRAVLSWVSTLVSLFPWFCTPAAPQGSPFPSWPNPAHAVVEGEAVTHPGASQLQHQLGIAEDFCFQPGCAASSRGVLLPRPFARASPCPASPGCAGLELQEAVTSDTAGPPSQGHVFPNDSNPAAFEQTL